MNIYLEYVHILYLVKGKNKTHYITENQQYLEDKNGQFFSR